MVPTEDRRGIRAHVGDRAAADCMVSEWWSPHHQEKMHCDAWAHCKNVVVVAPGDGDIGLPDTAIGVDSTLEGCAALLCL